MSTEIVLRISWDDIISKFSTTFVEVFHDNNSKRLYFSDGTTIDGATSSWIPAAILGAMLDIVQGSTALVLCCFCYTVEILT